MTVTRNMQVIVNKNGNLSFKTTDCSLLIKKDGERTVVSSKGKERLVNFPAGSQPSGHRCGGVSDLSIIGPVRITMMFHKSRTLVTDFKR